MQILPMWWYICHTKTEGKLWVHVCSRCDDCSTVSSSCLPRSCLIFGRHEKEHQWLLKCITTPFNCANFSVKMQILPMWWYIGHTKTKCKLCRSLFCQRRFYLCGDISATPRQTVNRGSMYVHAVMIVPQPVLAVSQEVVWFLVDIKQNINDFVYMHQDPFQLCKLF